MFMDFQFGVLLSQSSLVFGQVASGVVLFFHGVIWSSDSSPPALLFPFTKLADLRSACVRHEPYNRVRPVFMGLEFSAYELITYGGRYTVNQVSARKLEQRKRY